MLDRIRTLSDEIFSDVVQLRRTIHRNPELAFEESETADLIAKTLKDRGIDPITGVAKTGVVGMIEGGKPGPTLALRADIDALPIQEENTFDFVSKNPGRMHACGHDAHTASLLGAATILSEIKDNLHGSIRLIFQPSEEKLPGGAKVMIEEGVLGELHGQHPPEAILGQHVFPQLPTGTIGVRSGPFMASGDEVYITINGKGGHAAAPQDLIDPVLIQAHILTALQAVISRSRPPDQPSILSFGKVIAEGATNIIPSKASLVGTFRAMNEEWRYQAHELIRQTATHTAEAFGATADVEIVTGYPALTNEPETAHKVRSVAIDYVGEDQVVDLPMWYASEDFAWYTQKIPGAFYVLGVGNAAKGITHGLHTPRFTIEEEALRLGPGFMAYAAWKIGNELV